MTPTSSPYLRSLVWLRRDLRLSDHAALSPALRHADRVALCFVFDRSILDPLPRTDRRVAFIRESLVDVEARLRQLGGALWVTHGTPSDAIPALAERLGARVVVAAQDYEPAAISTRTRYDMVFMDIQMPVMDGVSATQEIRRIPGCDRLPVIAVTANVLESDHRHYRASGISEIIAKPIEPATIYATVARHAPGGARAPLSASAADPAAPSGHIPLFDVEAALGFLGGNRDLLIRSVRMFIASNEHDVEQILALIAAADLKTASRRFHRLKGSAAMLGCRRLSEVSAALERDLKAADAKAPADHRLRVFSEAMGQTLQALRQYAGAAPH